VAVAAHAKLSKMQVSCAPASNQRPRVLPEIVSVWVGLLVRTLRTHHELLMNEVKR